MTMILMTIIVCMTLLAISSLLIFKGVDIRFKKEYTHVYKDETHYQTAPQEKNDDEVKANDIESFVTTTMTTLNNYLEEDKVNAKE